MTKDTKATGYNTVRLVRNDPEIAAMVSKTVRDPRASTTRDEHGNRKTVLPQTGIYKQRSQKRAKRNSDTKMILSLLPDLELGVQILTSSILSPGDMMTTELIYNAPADIFTSKLSTTLIDKVKKYFEQDYKIAPLLSKMLRDIIAEKGSYPVVVLPENAIDEMINGRINVSTEAISRFTSTSGVAKNVGVLGSPKTEKASSMLFSLESLTSVNSAYSDSDYQLHYSTGHESYATDEFTKVTDNPTALKMPLLYAKIKAAHTRRMVGVGMESVNVAKKRISDSQIEGVIYRDRQFKNEQVASAVSQAELPRRSVGRPLIMALPSEAVLPVHVPGNPSEHVGYFIILDEEGNPIGSYGDEHMHYDSMSSSMSAGGGSLSSNIIQRVGANFGVGDFNSGNQMHLDYATQIYGDMIERDLIARIKNGVHSTSVNIAKNEEIYRVMLARTLARKYTQLLYIPCEYMTYMAFKYGDDGIGKSLLDDLSTINTLRTVVMFSDVIASVKNSIGRTSVDLTLDPKDPNPLKTIEMIQDDTIRTRQLAIPNGVQSPADITDWINKAGFEWHIKNHPGIPEIDVAFTQLNSQVTRPDSELADSLRKQSGFGLGIPTEMIDSALSNAEFATTVTKNNILFSKRILQHQETFEPHLSSHMRKIIRFDETLAQQLIEIVMENTDELLYEIDPEKNAALMALPEEQRNRLVAEKAYGDFLDNFTVSLPRPGTVTLQSQIEEYNNYKDGLDAMIDAYVSSDTFTEVTAGGMSQHVDTIKAMIRAHFLRKYMAEKGIMTELGDIINLDDDDENSHGILKEEAKHIESMVRFAVKAIARLKPIADAATKDLESMGAAEGESSTDDTDSDETTDDTGGDMDTMPDDIGDESEMPAEEPPAVDTSTTGGEEEPDPTPDM